MSLLASSSMDSRLISPRLDRGPRSAPPADHRRVPSQWWPWTNRLGPTRATRPRSTEVAASYLMGLACLLGLVRLHRRQRERGEYRVDPCCLESQRGFESRPASQSQFRGRTATDLGGERIVAELFVGDNPEESRSLVRSAVKDGSRVRVDRTRPGPNPGARWHHLRRVGTSMVPSWGEPLPVDGGRCLPAIGDLGIDVLAWRNRAREG